MKYKIFITTAKERITAQTIINLLMSFLIDNFGMYIEIINNGKDGKKYLPWTPSIVVLASPVNAIYMAVTTASEVNKNDPANKDLIKISLFLFWNDIFSEYIATKHKMPNKIIKG